MENFNSKSEIIVKKLEGVLDLIFWRQQLQSFVIRLRVHTESLQWHGKSCMCVLCSWAYLWGVNWKNSWHSQRVQIVIRNFHNDFLRTLFHFSHKRIHVYIIAKSAYKYTQAHIQISNKCCFAHLAGLNNVLCFE